MVESMSREDVHVLRRALEIEVKGRTWVAQVEEESMSMKDGHVLRRTLEIVVEGQTEDMGEAGCGRKHEQGR